LLAVGILGATVMPHVIYLHSALLQNRIRPETDEQARTLMRFTRIDVVLAMTIAGLINMAMLVMAASVFFKSGLVHVASLEPARRHGRAREPPRDHRRGRRRRSAHLGAERLPPDSDVQRPLGVPRTAISPFMCCNEEVKARVRTLPCLTKVVSRRRRPSPPGR